MGLGRAAGARISASEAVKFGVRWLEQWCIACMHVELPMVFCRWTTCARHDAAAWRCAERAATLRCRWAEPLVMERWSVRWRLSSPLPA